MFKKILIINLIVISILSVLVLSIDRAATVMQEQSPLIRQQCLVIDPGHGGMDGGASSVYGTSESQLNLEISLRLRDLCHLLGIKTVMIREEDRSVHTAGESIAQKKVSDLQNRVKTVKSQGNPILVSIHQNYFPLEKYYGAQVFYSNTTESKNLANNLQSALVNNLNPNSKRKAKLASGIYLMEHINCPGILIECGFLSNNQEAQKLADPEYQKQLCVVIASTLSTYLNSKS